MSEETSIGSHCLVAEVGNTMPITIEESLEEAIETFARLYTLGHFSKAASLFEDILKPYLAELPVFAEYANFLIQQGNYGVLLDRVNERIRMRNDPMLEVQEEETVYLELLQALSMLHSEGKLVETLEALKRRSSFYPTLIRPPIELTYIQVCNPFDQSGIGLSLTKLQIRSAVIYLAIIMAVISILPKAAVEYTNNVTIKLSETKTYVFEMSGTTSSEHRWGVIQDWCIMLADDHPQEAVNVFRTLLNAPHDHYERWCVKFIYSLEKSKGEHQASFVLARVGAVNAWKSHCFRHRQRWEYERLEQSFPSLKEIYPGGYDKRSHQVIESSLNEIAVGRQYKALPGLADIARQEANHRMESYCFELMVEASGSKEIFFSAIAPVLEFPGAPWSHVAQDAIELVTILDRLFTDSLHKTVSIGSLAAVRLLLDRGDNISETDQEGRDCIHQAAYKGYKDIAQLLCNHDETLLSHMDQNCYLPLHIAAENGHDALLPLLMGLGKEYLHTHVPEMSERRHGRSFLGGTALHLASANGHEGAVSSLLHCGANVDGKDSLGWTALHKSCARWQYGVASILLRHGADVNSKTDEGLTALCLATKAEHTALVDLLLQHHAVTGSDGSDGSALSFAAEIGNLEIAKLLLGYGADIQEAPREGRSPLHIAVKNGHLNIVRLFLEENPNFEEKDGQRTALHLAAGEGHSELVELLLGHGANIEVRDAAQKTALHFAANSVHLDAVKTLLEHGADIEAIDADRKTALHEAARGSRSEVIKLLLGHGANVEARDGDQRTALHFAAQHGNSDAMRALLEHGAEIDARDKNETTALHFAARDGRLSAMRLLLTHGADVDARCNDETALYQTAKNSEEATKKLEVAEILLEHKADVGAKTAQGSWTALHIAARDGDKGMVELLLKNLKVKSVLAELAGESQEAKTPEKWAAKNRHYDIALLIDKAEKSWVD